MRSRRPAVRVHPTPPIGPTDRPKDSNQHVRLAESQTRRETPHPSSLACGQGHIHGRNRSRGPGLGLAQLGACRNRDPRCLRLGWAAVWGFFNGSLPPALHLLLAARHQRRPGMNVVDRQARRSGTRRCRGWCSRENCYAYRRACLGSDVDLVVLTDQPGRYGPWGRPTGRSLQASSSLPAVAPILRRRVIVQNDVLNQDTLSSTH